LEITNRSLLAINASLETTKHRQAKEIRDLRRKLRESRLLLPPRAYRAMKVSFEDDATDEDGGEDDENATKPEDGQDDEVYNRLRHMIDGLIQSGKRALESKPEDFGSGGKKVLSAEEVRSWIGSEDDGHSTDADTVGKRKAESSRPVSPWKIAVPHESDGFLSEEDFNAERFERGLVTPPPPIRIVPST
jgi:hypothetical protein